MPSPRSRAPLPVSPWRWAILGASLGLLVSLVLFAPASWLASGIRQASASRVQLQAVRGTIWEGSARLVLSGGAGSIDLAGLPGRVAWRLRPTWRGLDTWLSAPCCADQPVRLRLLPRWAGGRIEVEDHPSRWPAALLAGLGTPWNTVQAEGQLQLVTKALSVEWTAGGWTVSGSAELAAVGLSSRLSTLKPMGSYRITLTGGTTTTLTLATIEGRLQLQGSGRWVGSRLRFEGEASAAPEHEAALSNLLNIIGRRSGARSIITVG